MGPFNLGTVFKVNIDGTGFSNLHSFTGVNEGGGPTIGLALSGNTLYRTTYYLGEAAWGTVFRLETDGADFSNLSLTSAYTRAGRARNKVSLGSPAARRGCSSLATRPVQPVWCEAPTPRPVSP